MSCRVDPETGRGFASSLGCRGLRNHNKPGAGGWANHGREPGIGQVLGEDLRYDENGQLPSGTFMDYAVPRADIIPPIEILHVTTPQAGTKLGAKGAS